MPVSEAEKHFASRYRNAMRAVSSVREAFPDELEGYAPDLPDPTALRTRLANAFEGQAERLGRCFAVVDVRKVIEDTVTKIIRDDVEKRSAAGMVTRVVHAFRRDVLGDAPEQEAYEEAWTAAMTVDQPDFRTSNEAFVESVEFVLGDQAESFLRDVEAAYANRAEHAVVELCDDLEDVFLQAAEGKGQEPAVVLKNIERASWAFVQQEEQSHMHPEWIGFFPSGQDGGPRMYEASPSLALSLLEQGGAAPAMKRAAILVAQASEPLASYARKHDEVRIAAGLLDEDLADDPSAWKQRAIEISVAVRAEGIEAGRSAAG